MSQPSPVRLSQPPGLEILIAVELHGDCAARIRRRPFDIALTERRLKSTIDSLRADQCRRIEIVGLPS
jgi:hypothetical protein